MRDEVGNFILRRLLKAMNFSFTTPCKRTANIGRGAYTYNIQKSYQEWYVAVAWNVAKHRPQTNDRRSIFSSQLLQHRPYADDFLSSNLWSSDSWMMPISVKELKIEQRVFSKERHFFMDLYLV